MSPWWWMGRSAQPKAVGERKKPWARPRRVGHCIYVPAMWPSQRRTAVLLTYSYGANGTLLRIYPHGEGMMPWSGEVAPATRAQENSGGADCTTRSESMRPGFPQTLRLRRTPNQRRHSRKCREGRGHTDIRTNVGTRQLKGNADVVCSPPLHRLNVERGASRCSGLSLYRMTSAGCAGCVSVGRKLTVRPKARPVTRPHEGSRSTCRPWPHADRPAETPPRPPPSWPTRGSLGPDQTWRGQAIRQQNTCT
jgi:hypothetical protein